MIRCHLSRILGEQKIKMADVIRQTGISRGTITRLYYEEATRIEFEVAEKLCRLLRVGMGELLEYLDDEKRGEEPEEKN